MTDEIVQIHTIIFIYSDRDTKVIDTCYLKNMKNTER